MDLDADSPVVWLVALVVVAAMLAMITGSIAQGVVAGLFLVAMAFTFRRMGRM